MAHPRISELTSILKSLSPVPEGMEATSYTAIVGFALGKAMDDVAAYTHIDDTKLPVGLDRTLVQLALAEITGLGLLQATNSGDLPATAVSEGDASVTYMSPAEAYTALMSSSALTSPAILAVLHTYRRVAP